MKKSLFFFLYIIFTTTLFAQSWLRKFPVFYQQVNAMAQYGDTLFVGGSFDRVGPNEGKTTVIDSATGNVNTTFPRMYNYSKLIPDGNGGMFVTGDASIQIGGQFRSRLAHVYANGVLSAWNPRPNGIIKELKVYGDKVYVMGDFDSVGGQRRRYIAALDTSTGAATSWNLNIDQRITTFAVTNNSVYVAGQFTFIAGQVRGVLAAFDATTGAITSWDPNGGTIFTAFNPAVTRLEAYGNTIYVSGTFTSIGGQARNLIAAINATTGAVTPWNLNLSSSNEIKDWKISGNLLYIAGSSVRNGLASYDLTTGLITAWNPNINYTNIPTSSVITSLSVSGNTVYVSWGNVNWTNNKFIRAFDAVTGALLPWGGEFLTNGYPPLGNVTYATAIAGKIFAYGYFYSFNVQTTQPLVAISATTGDIIDLNYNVHGIISKLVTAGNKLYVIGNFDSIGGQRRIRLAAIDLTNGSVTPWNPNPNITVTDLAVNAGTVYLSGNFTSIGGQVRNYLAAVDTGTGLATSWAPVVNTSGNKLSVNANKLYVGGNFTTIGGQTRNNLASFDLSTGTLTAWNPNPNGPIIGFAKNDSSFFVLGDYTNISSQNRIKLAAFDLTTDTLKSFTSSIMNIPGATLGLVANNNRVYVFGGGVNPCSGGSGCFGTYFGCADARTGQIIPWNYAIGGGFPNSGLGGTTANGIYTAHLSGDKIYVGGMFLNVGAYTSVNFAVFGDSTTTNNPLPLRSLYLTAQKSGNFILLKWQAEDESDIAKYEVEKSSDGRSFSSIGTSIANGAKKYNTVDATPFNTNFYRVKATSKDGKVYFSSIVKLTIQGTGEFTLYPNPVTGNELQLHLNNVQEGNYKVAVYNLSGQKLLQQKLTHAGGSVTLGLKVNKLSAGTNILTITDQSGKIIVKEKWIKM